ncbi:GNAT family N-acetyltransferase [Flammeovirga sp. EKP202]|uniref:GNAT family N-acetyltransferase n=1 Tax=Flammeovirga sp. EKP202 TaxID=2770592 RepID=UPI0016600478|nr:GNAT family N-acetyltransferase [Flammeovirga sp. EKP202]MBD0401492.1 GNAT family N-acetyltransferase [Flammeovirga sp. EKP202]
MKTFHIESERLLLRELREEDVEGMFALDSNPNVVKFIGIPPLTDKAKSLEYIYNIQQQYEEKGIGRWACILKETNEFIGWAGLKIEEVLSEFGPYHDLGYRLREEFWGKGYATEAAKISLDYAFEVLGWNDVEACADFDNEGSNHVLRKIGMRHTRDSMYEGMPLHWYKITKLEWMQKSSIG